MYGTILQMRVKDGEAATVHDLVNEWNRNFRPNISGAHGAYLMMTDADPDVLIGVVMFSDRRAYRENAESPVQNAWYERLRAALAEEPAWDDGEYIISSI